MAPPTAMSGWPLREPVFTRFRNLPPELQIMTWKQAIPEPRLVEIRQRELPITVGKWNELMKERAFKKNINYGWSENHTSLQLVDGMWLEADETRELRESARRTLAQLQERGASSLDAVYPNRNYLDLVWGGYVMNYLRLGKFAIPDLLNLLGFSTSRELGTYLRLASQEPYTALFQGEVREVDGDAFLAAILDMPILRFRATTPAPSILAACKQSSHIASAHYRKGFRSWTLGRKPEVYFDYKRDILYLRHHTIGFHGTGIIRVLDLANVVLEKPDIGRVENLAFLFDEDASLDRVGSIFFNDVPRINPTTLLLSLLGSFPAIKKLTLVLKHYHSPSEAPGQEFDNTQSTLIPPLDLDGTIAVRRVFLESDDGFALVDSVNFEVPLAHPWAEVDVDVLRERWNFGNICELEYEVAVTERRRNELEELGAACREKLKRMRERS